MRLTIPKHLVEEIMVFARGNHPKEVILLLRGSRKNDVLSVTEYLFPPYGSGGRGHASFPARMLPIDFTIIGTLHSHPSGNLRPSVGDMHNFYGRVMAIVGPPFTTSSIAAYTGDGKAIPVEVLPE
ncbi:MAG: Mov34/MPN/PAD-1 family protein [Candidatus Bathyarchaeota archaeon]|nr:Mov34/MPN/PAD-1 family protein [Candidatus Bathyarchaeota archaeon]